MTKEELRRDYKQRRLALSFAEKDKLEDLILIQFQKLDILIPELIMTYSAMEQLKEFDPQLITDYCYFKNNEQVLFYPSVSDGEKMDCIGVDDDSIFELNNYGINEPVNGLVLPAADLDMVFVPMLAFDLNGDRVGYGKGYYDRFLKQCRPDCLKIGFSFFDAVEKIEGTDRHDVKLNYCITPEMIHTFK